MEKLRQFLGIGPVLPSSLFKLVQACIEKVLPKSSSAQMAMFMAERGKLPEAVSALAGAEDFMEDMISKDDQQAAKECTDIHGMIHVACL
eukprot:2398174-Lingulodinium_polyedra.AAC.1